MTNLSYFDEPTCAFCEHPRVVHRGADHDGKCVAARCKCPIFGARTEVA